MSLAERTTHDGRNGSHGPYRNLPVPPPRSEATAPAPWHHAEGLEAGKRSTRTLLWVLLAAAMVLYGFPFLYLLFTSFKTPIDTIAVPPTILPGNGRWRTTPTHWAAAESSPPSSTASQTAIISTVLSLVLAVPAAYGITRYKTLSGRVFIMAALVTRMVPPVAIGIPLASHDGRRRAWPIPPSPCPSPTPPSRCRCPSG